MKSTHTKDAPKLGLVARQRLRQVLIASLNESCPYSWATALVGHIRASHWQKLYEWAESTTTEVYGDAAEHYAATQIASLVRKYPWSLAEVGLTTHPEQAAYATFLLSEEKCRKSNLRLKESRVRRSSYVKYITYMRRWIKKVLGETPDLPSIYDECGFTSGAAVGVHGDATNIYRKLFAEDWTVTPGAEMMAMHALWSNDQIRESFYESRGGILCFDDAVAQMNMRVRIRLISFNKVSFVPKTTKTHRSIAIEPLLNSFLQKGIDTTMRRKLHAWGYDLTDQTRNAALARKGSIDGTLATVDLSSASDSISIEICRLLLPPEWFSLLSYTRSGTYSYRGLETRFEKFVTMGNGFCFPLQTLLFAAAARAAIHFTGSETTHSVYGDDIIIPSDACPLLRNILSFCGFTVNPLKSFSEGPFRESCGADWYLGQDVRPVYLDFHLVGDTNLMIFHNATLRSKRAEDFFSAVRPLLLGWVPAERRFVRPISVVGRPSKTYSYAKDYEEIRMSNGAFTVQLDTFMSSKFSLWQSHTFSWTWTERKFIPIEDTYSPNGERIVNEQTWEYHRAKYLSFLGGNPEGKLSLRRKTKQVTTTIGVTSPT